MISNDVCNGVSGAFVTLTPTQPDPARPSPARPMSFWSPSIHIVQSLTREATSPSAPTSEPAWMERAGTGLALIEGVDIDAPLVCETTDTAGHCDNAADFVINSHITRRFFLCAHCWDAEDEFEWHCRVTDAIETRDDHFRIVGVLR